MIHEFAVDPQVMAHWRHFQAIHDDFGAARGRMLARYPKSWAKDVAMEAHQLTHAMVNSPINAKRIEEHLFSESFKRKLVPARRPFDGGQSWLVNALARQKHQPFHAVIASTVPAPRPDVLLASEFLKTDAPYHIETSQKIPRTAESLAQCAQALLQYGQELILVDPHFKPVTRFLATFRKLLDLRAHSPSPLRKLELHIRRPKEEDIGNLQHNLRLSLAPIVPSGIAMEIFF